MFSSDITQKIYVIELKMLKFWFTRIHGYPLSMKQKMLLETWTCIYSNFVVS